MSWSHRLVVLVGLALFVLTGCQAEVTVTVLVDDEHGSGVVQVDVELDREAVDRLEGTDQLRTADLVAAGWSVADPVEADDGGVALVATKRFADGVELGEVLEEVSGPDGPYGRLGLRIERSFARTEFVVEGVLDGSGGIASFADPGVALELDGQPFGIDPAELEAELGVPLGSLVGLRLIVELPGEQTQGDPAAGADPNESGPAEWRTDLAASDPVPVLTTSETVRTQSVLLAMVAAGFAVLFVVILLVWLVVVLRRRRRRKRAARVAARAPRPLAETTAEAAPTVEAPGGAVTAAGDRAPAEEGGAAGASGDDDAPPLRLVIVGGPGAAFGVRDPVDDVVAFARARGSMLEYPRIAEHYAEAELGRLSTAELWVAVGAEGDPATLDEELLGQYQLAPGLREFVVRARGRGYRVAYLGDGPAAWVDHMRRSFVLDDLIDPWVVSSSVGARTPDTAIFEAMRRMSDTEPASCLLIDDRLRVLEAAHALGFGTAWFSPTGRSTEAPGHSIIRGFADLLSG